MTVYWLLFLVPLAGVLLPGPLAADARRLAWFGLAMLAALAIGLRHEIGVDWDQYIDILERVGDEDMRSAARVTDPGYSFINLLSALAGWGVTGVNLVCGILFASGLAAFARRQPMPWVAWLVATPYLLVVVAMGYSRQGVALGFVFWGLAHLQEKRTWRFLLLVTLGATFHQSAAIMLPLAFLIKGRKSWLEVAGLMLAVLAAGIAFLLIQAESLWSNYIEDKMVSEGTGVRVWMNILPAFLMLVAARRWNRLWPDPGHWRWIAWLAIGCILFVDIASTAIDRTALYLAPVQVYVWSRFPLLFRDPALRARVTLGICLSYAAVMWVWLNLAIHAAWWVPYRSVLLP